MHLVSAGGLFSSIIERMMEDNAYEVTAFPHLRYKWMDGFCNCQLLHYAAKIKKTVKEME